MLKKPAINYNHLNINKNTILTLILVLFSIGSYTYSESTDHPNTPKMDRLKRMTTLVDLSLKIPIHYSTPVVDIDVVSTKDIKTVVVVPSEKVMDDGFIDASLLARFLLTNNKAADTSFVINLAEVYLKEAKHEGVNPELAFTQMCLETGFLRFNGDVDPKQNNFCGLGVTGNGVKGLSFSTPEQGVRAHIQHLKAYGSTQKLNNELVDSRFKLVKRGSGRNLRDLTGKWATDRLYDKKIRNLLNRLYTMSNVSVKTNS